MLLHAEEPQQAKWSKQKKSRDGTCLVNNGFTARRAVPFHTPQVSLSVILQCDTPLVRKHPRSFMKSIIIIHSTDSS